MNVLVAAASKYGSTFEIARHIGRVLGNRGATVTLSPIEDFPKVEAFDAAILGSGVYMSRWIVAAGEYVDSCADNVREIPVWLFSSGPLGDGDTISDIDPEAVARLVAQVEAREHRVFPGRLELDELDLGDRRVASAAHAPEGDFRDWDAIHAWAQHIADTLGLEDQVDAKRVAAAQTTGASGRIDTIF